MRGLQSLLENRPNRLHKSLANLEGNVADKAVADNDVGVSVVKVTAFDIAEEIQRQRLDELEGITGKVVPLGLFFADRQQSHPRIAGGGKASAEDRTEVNVSHDGELLKVLRLAIDVRAHVQHDRGSLGGGGKNVGKRRTIDPGNDAENHLGRDHGGSGISSRDETGGGTVLDQTKSRPASKSRASA